MKLIQKLLIALVAVFAIGFATPVQAHGHGDRHYHRGGYYHHHYYGGGPRVYYYGGGPYYEPYYAPVYYGPAYYDYGPSVTVAVYHRHHHFFW